MSEDEERAEFIASMQSFAGSNEARNADYVSTEQEIAVLTEQINAKIDHLRQLQEQRSGLIVKCQSIRNAGQDAAMKYMTDYIEMVARDN